MAANSPVNLARRRGTFRSAVGWIGLGIALVVNALCAMFLAGGMVSFLLTAGTAAKAIEGMIAGLPPFLLVLALVGCALLAAAVPRAGIGFAVIGLAGFIYLGHPLGLLQANFMMAAGAALALGHPEPRQLAVRLAWLIPLLAALLSALITVTIYIIRPDLVQPH